MTTNSAFDLIGLNALRSDPRYRNIDGQVDEGPQLAVAILDTGLYGSHPLLDNNFLGYGDFLDNNTGQAVTAEEVVFTSDPTASQDLNGHGTHVAGTIGAEDDSISVAPGVRLLGLNVIGAPFTNNTSLSEIQDAVINGLQWVRNNRQGTINEQEYRIVSLNMSLGFYGKITSVENAPYALQGIFTAEDELDERSANSPERRAAALTAELENAGITVVSATGNDYDAQARLKELGQTLPNGEEIPQQNVSTPAISSSIAAGSLDVRGGAISSFSQRLNFGSMLFAPGGDVFSTISPEQDNDGDGFAVLSGTSMASPHIAGAIALMQDAALTYGGRTLSATEIQQILISTADTVNDGDDENYAAPTTSTEVDYLQMNIYAAIQEIDRRFGGTPQPTPDPDEPTPNSNDPNGIINAAISLENDVGFTLDNLSEFTVVGTEIIGTDGETEVGGSDVDLISFNVPEVGGLVAIETTFGNTDESVDTILRLFDSAGNEIAVDDDGGESNFSRVEAILGQGTYFVGVSGYNNIDYNPNTVNSGTAGSEGEYGLGFQFQSGTGVDGSSGDRNGTIDTAFIVDTLVFDETELQTTISTIGSDPVSEVSERVSVGRTDVDIVSFEVAIPGVMVIETAQSSSDDSDDGESLDSVLRLFDSAGNEIAFDDDSGDGSFSQIETSLDTGTYYLGVSGYNNTSYDSNSLEGRVEGSTGEVDITFDFQTLDNTDPNGIRSGATEIDLVAGEVTLVEGEIGTDFGDIVVNEEDVDLVSFTATQDATLLIDTDTPFGTEFANETDEITFADTYLRFFDADGVEIASSDDDFAEDVSGEIVEFDDDVDGVTENPSGNLIGHDLDSFLRVDVEAGETYYVGVSGYGNDSYDIASLSDDRFSLDSGGSYQLLITNITTSDLDGSISQAPTFGFDDSANSDRIDGNIGFDEDLEIGDSDVDIYEYAPSQRGLLQLDIDAFSTLDSPVDSMLFLFDAQGNELAFNDDEASGSLDAHLEYLVDGGETYYLAVAGYGNGDFNVNYPGSGEAGDTGDYTLNIDLLEPQAVDSVEENPFAAAFADFFASETFSSQLDFDREIVGPAFSSLDSSSYDSLSLGDTVVSFLGEDPQGFDNIFNPFADLYNQASAVFGSSESGTITNGGFPEDADYFPISLTEAGRYDLRTLVSSTEVGSIGTQTKLRLYNANREQIDVTSCQIGLSGVNDRVTVNISNPGDYYIVVLPDGSASDRFDFANHTFGELSALERQEFASSLGEYALSADRFVLQATNNPRFSNGALRLQLNDCIAPEELDRDSVVVTDNNGNRIDGSVAVSERGEVSFVPTNPLTEGEYEVTYASDDFVTLDTSFSGQRNLDGDKDGTAGGNLIANFSVETGNIFLSVPSFGRTPGQAVNVRGTGLPISVSNAEGLKDIRIRVDYDSSLLNITDATVASGLPDDWTISQLDISNNRVVIDLAGTTPLNSGTTELVRLNAIVPEDAPLGDSQVLQVSGGQINENNDSLVFAETAAVQNLSAIDDPPVGDTIELFRFRNTTFESGTYIFVGAAERDNILADENFRNTFALDGVQEDGSTNPAFTASLQPGEDLIPFYRIRSLDVPGTYLFVSTEEYNGIFAENSVQRDKWEKEGLDTEGADIPEFYLYEGTSDRGVEFNRFQNTQNNTFLYAGPEETEAIQNDPNLFNLFTNQGIAFESLV